MVMETTKNRSVDIVDEQRDAIIGFHSFTENDYSLAFFRKGKNGWSVMMSRNRFVEAFRRLGNE